VELGRHGAAVYLDEEGLEIATGGRHSPGVVERDRGEVAVGTLAGAEGDMDVEAERAAFSRRS
jgi:hypothetical protein